MVCAKQKSAPAGALCGLNYGPAAGGVGGPEVYCAAVMSATLIFRIVRMTGRLRGSPDRRIRSLGWGLLGATIVVAAHNAFDVTFVDPKTSVLVWTLLGVGAAAARIDATA